MGTYKGRKIVGARLHEFIFVGGTQVGPKVETGAGARACDLDFDGECLIVTTKSRQTVVVPMANVVQLELGATVEPQENK